MSGLENFNAELAQKHEREDAEINLLGSKIKEQVGDTKDLVSNLDILWKDMMAENYDSAKENFENIKSKLNQIPELNNMLAFIEEGLVGMEVNKYDQASRKVRELKEMLEN